MPPSVQNDNDAAVVIGKEIVNFIKSLPDQDAAKVHFARGYAIQPDELPCISIEIGSDTPAEPDGLQMNGFTDSILVVNVDIYDQSNTAVGLSRLFRQRALCHKAIMTDYTLGGLVIQVRYAGSAEPIYDPETGLTGWMLRVPFMVHYRFSDLDRTVLIN